MASRKELEVDDVELQKHVERAIRELDHFGGELEEILDGRDDAEARSLRILARRARYVARELGEELREGVDRETVGLLVRFFHHEYTRKVIGGLLTGLAAKYGPDLVEQANLAVDAAESVLSVLAGLGGENPTESALSVPRLGVERVGGSRPEDTYVTRVGSATVSPETATARAEVPEPTVVSGQGSTVSVGTGTAHVTSEPVEAVGLDDTVESELTRDPILDTTGEPIEAVDGDPNEGA